MVTLTQVSDTVLLLYSLLNELSRVTNPIDPIDAVVFSVCVDFLQEISLDKVSNFLLPTVTPRLFS